MAIVITILAGIVIILLSNEISAWLPVFSKRLLARAVRRLPKELQARYAEEWEAHLLEIPGELSKIMHLVGLQYVGRRIRRSCSTPAEPTIERARGIKYTPGRTNFGLLPEPEGRSLAFVISSSLNAAILCTLLLAGMAAKQITFRVMPIIFGVVEETPQDKTSQAATISSAPSQTAPSPIVGGQP